VNRADQFQEFARLLERSRFHGHDMRHETAKVFVLSWMLTIRSLVERLPIRSSQQLFDIFDTFLQEISFRLQNLASRLQSYIL
jgi:hypothetical protein